MASHGSSIRRPPSHSYRVRSSSATSTASLFALLMMTLAQLGTNQVSASFQPSNNDINIGAFNVRQFGLTKTRNRVIMTEIARIVTQFDIIAIQEILNNADVATVLLDYVKQCNCSKEQSCLYAREISDPLGETGGQQRKCNRCPIETLSSSYKERYGFFYRTDTIQIVKIYQYQGSSFARPPFAVHVKLRNFNEIPEFLYIVVHTRPDNAANEINSLQRVYETFRQQSGISNVIIGGDLNAGCSYWRDKQNTALTEGNDYHWLINSNTATNVAGKCPYDRFIVKGRELMQHIRSESAGVYKYADSGRIDQVSAISDHYPIGMRLAVGRRANRSPPTCPTVNRNTKLPNPIFSRQQDPDWSPTFWFQPRRLGKRPRPMTADREA